MEHDARPMIPIGYAEHAPPPDLASSVACFWTRMPPPNAGVHAGSLHRVLPDGCVDIIVGLSHADDDAFDLMAVGTMTRPLILRDEAADVHIGVRFRPGYAYAALGIPAEELTDDRVDFERLASGDRRTLDDIAAEPTHGRRLELLVRLVRERIATAPIVPASVRRAVRAIAVDHGNVRVAGLAADIGITRQQLARQFAMHVGVSPKTFARVMRTRAALARADAARAAHPRAIDWSAIAHDLGFYDQPHFIDDFKAITGSTPGQWFAGS
jgi:AraC-like DNA-binding protein